MLYGHARNCGHGCRRADYDWTPSFAPNRRRKQRGGKRYRASRVSRPEPRISIVELFAHYPTLAPYRPEAKITFDPVANLKDLSLLASPVALAYVLIYWKVFAALGIASLLLGRIARKAKKIQDRYEKRLEQLGKPYRINRRISAKAPPSAAVLLATWKTAHAGRRGDPVALAARLRLGSMLSDLEPIVDQSYIRDHDGTIVGRRPGLKGWLGDNCPELIPHYKSLMAYKALADKLRVALKINDPDSIEDVLELPLADIKISVERRRTTDIRETEGKQSNVMDMPTKISVKERPDLRKSNAVDVMNACEGMFRKGIPRTMEALEVAVREELGLVWMRRQEKSDRVA